MLEKRNYFKRLKLLPIEDNYNFIRRASKIGSHYLFHSSSVGRAFGWSPKSSGSIPLCGTYKILLIVQ